MSTDLQLKSSCSGCGSTTDLYGSNCKHMILCLSCGKTMAEKRAKCVDCGATLTHFIREYNVRASSTNDKIYFIGRFINGLPDFSKKKSAENEWSLQKDGLHERQITDTLRVDDDVGVPPVIATKQKDALKEEPVDNSPPKPTATGPARGTPSSKSSKGKRKLNEEAKPSNTAPPKKVNLENEPKASTKDGNGSASKNSAPPKGTPPLSSKARSSTTASGPVSEEEVRAFLRQKTPVTTQDLVAKFKARLRCSEDKQAFAEILKRISMIQKTTSGVNYAILRDEPKASTKDGNGSASKNSAPPNGTPPLSSKAGSSTTASGPVSEEEIRAVLRQKTPVTTQDLVAKFKARLRCSEDKQAFAEILKRISLIQKTTSGVNYAILRDK